jgi:hypothetical protein
MRPAFWFNHFWFKSLRPRIPEARGGPHGANPRSRGAMRPRFDRSSRPMRAQGRPGARCTRGLVCNVQRKCAHEHTGPAESIRPSLRNGLTAYAELSPETNSSCLRHRRIDGFARPRLAVFKPRDGGLVGALPGRKFGLLQACAQASGAVRRLSQIPEPIHHTRRVSWLHGARIIATP